LLHSTFGNPPFHKYYGNFVKKAFSEAKSQNFVLHGGFAPVSPLFLHFFQKWIFKRERERV
jgi:hypothetical protein